MSRLNMDAFFDRLSKADLESLAVHTAQVCVSIHFAPHRGSREVRQDAARLRNLLERATLSVREYLPAPPR